MSMSGYEEPIEDLIDRSMQRKKLQEMQDTIDELRSKVDFLENKLNIAESHISNLQREF